MCIKLWSESLKERDHSEDLGVDWFDDNTRLDPREIVWEGVEWIYLAEGRDQWRILVNTLMNV